MELLVVHSDVYIHCNQLTITAIAHEYLYAPSRDNFCDCLIRA